MWIKLNSNLRRILGNFMISKAMHRLLLQKCAFILISCGLFIVVNLYESRNSAGRIDNEFSRNAVEPSEYVEKNITEINYLYQKQELQLHNYSSDNYYRANNVYSVSDLLPPKLLSTFEPINDRIHLQLNHVPKSYKDAINNKVDIPMKSIYFYGNQRNWYMKEGQSYFLIEKCPVNRCLVTYDKKKARNADAVVFSNPFHMPSRPPWPRRSQDQIWAVNALEAPSNTNKMSGYADYLNWTMTYRRDSTLTTPYFKFLYYSQPLPEQNISLNYAEGKTKQVAWMVSNCRLVSSGRMTYAKELAKHISVDIFGACGTKSCKKSESKKCFEMIKQEYKFYLVFENSKCMSYTTEKFSQNALSNNAIPIVLGVSRAEMRETAPPGSYIHVEDFENPRKLAEYLHKIDKDDNLFNEFFRWRRYGEMINTKTWCRFCSMLHETTIPTVTQKNIDEWWRGSGTCIGANNWRY